MSICPGLEDVNVCSRKVHQNQMKTADIDDSRFKSPYFQFDNHYGQDFSVWDRQGLSAFQFWQCFGIMFCSRAGCQHQTAGINLLKMI